MRDVAGEDLAQTVEAFCAKHFGSAAVRDELTEGGTQVHSSAAAARLAELGWLGIAIPSEHGGSGGTFADLATFLEAAWYGKAPVLGYQTSAIVGAWYQRFGSDEQKDTILRGIAAGRVESLAISEPEAGSDAGSIRCRAVATDDGYVLDGQKTWCSNVHLADHVLVIARTSGSGTEGLSAFVVPTDAPGLTVRPIPSLAGAELNDVFLSGCAVPRSALVGLEGQGWLQIMSGLVVERLVISATMLGLARRMLDDTLQYVRSRTQFGRPVGSFQAVRHRLADLSVEVECCRLLVRELTSATSPRLVAPYRASMAKLKVTEVAKQVALEGTQLMGAAGVATELDMERQLRMALLSTIYGGTSEIQRDIISANFGLT